MAEICGKAKAERRCGWETGRVLYARLNLSMAFTLKISMIAVSSIDFPCPKLQSGIL